MYTSYVYVHVPLFLPKSMQMHGAEVEGQSMEEDPEAAGSGFAGLVRERMPRA